MAPAKIIKNPFLPNRYDSSIQPVSVPVTVAETTNGEAKVLTCESKYVSVMPFGVSLGISPEQKTGPTYLHIFGEVVRQTVAEMDRGKAELFIALFNGLFFSYLVPFG